jgi:hypothetical protein
MKRRNKPMSKPRFVHITICDVPSEPVKEFSEKIVKPYYPSGISQAIKDLMKKAVEKDKEKKD